MQTKIGKEKDMAKKTRLIAQYEENVRKMNDKILKTKEEEIRSSIYETSSDPFKKTFVDMIKFLKANPGKQCLVISASSK